MTEILDRLRDLQRRDEAGETFGYVRDIWKCAADEIERLTRERDEYARQRNAQIEHDADEIEKLERERDAARAEATRLNNCHRIIAKQVGFYKPELPHFTKIEIYLGVLRAAAQCAAGPFPWELLDNDVDEQSQNK